MFLRPLWPILLACALGATASRGQTVLSSDFSSDPTATGWTYGGTLANGWSAANGYLTAQTGLEWRSPAFSVSPLDYTKITFRSNIAPPARGYPDYFSTVYINPNPTWNFDPTHPGPSGHDLIADDYTAAPSSSGWVTNTFYTRAQANATSAAIRFQGLNSQALIDDVQVERVTNRSEVAAWTDAVWAARPTSPSLPSPAALPYTPAPGRFAKMPRVAAKLAGGLSLNVVMLGDSIINDMANSAFDVLVERNNPGTRVNVYSAVGGGTGMDKWAPSGSSYPYAPSTQYNGALHFDEAVVELGHGYLNHADTLNANQGPDVIVIGGISTPPTAAGYNAIKEVIDKARAGVLARWGYTPDILLTTGAFGTGASGGATGNPAVLGFVRGDQAADANTPGTYAYDNGWYPTSALNTDPIYDAAHLLDYRSNLDRIALDEGTGFLDMMGVWGEYMIEAEGGTVAGRLASHTAYTLSDPNTYDAYWRDGTHANTYGKQIEAQTLAGFFTAIVVPEPSATLLLSTAAALFLARRRQLGLRDAVRGNR
jgi:hypothetical protein